MLMWVPADWVAAGMTGLPGTDVEIVTQKRAQRRVVRLAREQAEAYLRGDPLRNVISGTY